MTITNITPGTTIDSAWGNAVTDAVNQVSVAGAITMFGGAAAPSGYLLCNGAAVSRTTYADLFANIGVLYGNGDGSTTFNVPDLRSRFPAGLGSAGWSDVLNDTGGQADGILPSHTHTQPTHQHTGPSHTHSVTADAAGSHSHSATGPLMGGKTTGFTNKTEASYIGGNRAGDSNVNIAGDGNHTHTGTAAASGTGLTGAGGGDATGSSGSSPTNTNLPPYITLNFIIKT